MKGKLLDTNIALFALGAPDRLTRTARSAILSGPNVLSVLSYWEVMLKSRKGLLEMEDPRQWWLDALERLTATPLLLRPEHVTAVYELPSHHKDPFDRILIAQATTEKLALITSDKDIARYASKEFEVIR